MSKNLSVFLNVVLLIAVAVLYYLHFSSAPGETTPANNDNDTSKSEIVKPIVKSPQDIKNSKIVFINTDKLNEEYQMVVDLTATIKAQKQSLDAKYEKKAKEFEEKYMEFQQKAQQGLLSENQRISAQNELMKQKEELDGMDMQVQNLADKMQTDNDKVFKTVIDYIKEYNQKSNYNYILAYTNSALSPVLLASDSLDITNEIIDGLNEQYKANKGNKKK